MPLDLVQASLRTILAHQAPNGALIAAPTFAIYHYSWLRDGSFIAHALDRAGAVSASAAFHGWVARTVLAHGERAAAAIALAREGLPPREGSYLHCRYTLEGREGAEGWPNFQLDGYGTWLWALVQHLEMDATAQGSTAGWAARLTSEQRAAARLVTDYVQALWEYPTYDCWEEHGDRLHPATLACLYGGLKAAARLLDDLAAEETANRIGQRVRKDAARLGRIPKFLGADGVDSSLLWCSTPFGLVAPDDPLMQATVTAIERGCVDADGGVHRYPEDSYYGGGAWLLLTAWLGWHYAVTGRRAEAKRCLDWVESRARTAGALPEQVAEHLRSPPHLPEWEARWGPSASPLLWSHAMHLVLRLELRLELGEEVAR